MDIQLSSNFERLLFELYDRSHKDVNQIMTQLRSEGKFTLTPLVWSRFKAEFAAFAVDDDLTKQTIRETYEATEELLDPHTAVGLAAGMRKRKDISAPLVVLATAHPAKFPDAVKDATKVAPKLPAHLKNLAKAKERFEVLPNDKAAVKRYIETHLI
jgi:threonine synthase